MAKRLNVNLAFTADTSKAKAQLQDLQSQLSNLMNTAPLSDKLSVSEAAKTAAGQIAQLKAQLDNATNSAGKLDLTKFNESLKRSGMTITDYRKALTSLGPEGSKAFSNLATSIMNAEVPLKRTNALLDEFVVTLKNSARWQISSNILHGLESTLSSAVGYAESLNKSLTDIRIVTGYSSDQMAEFAEQANKAAKALNTTTTRYSDAALIYYQQGLSEQEVMERTDITVKMANVTGEAAQTISDQMTAVWNNFYDGSKSLEYYSDVLTKLGADTASSTNEITEGLEKFASVTGTIGLSYEYAAASLATITATTRGSASVVGTALKTLFSRIQGLKLGETLEDGTDLNKYSKALAKVGIDIKDQNGELRDMDDILDEMGAKWGTLSRDQQTALAQTVAGVRQYTQLMALMNNWDFFQENLESAYNATGALDEQADIFAESWEAASNRVRAAAEGIYQDIIDDDFMIDMLDGLESVLSGVDRFIDALGGVEGVLLTIGALSTKIFHKQISTELNNLGFTLKNTFSKQSLKDAETLRKEASDNLNKSFEGTKYGKSEEGKANIEGLSRQAKIQQILIDQADNLSEEDKKRLQYILDLNKALTEQNIILGRQADKAAQQKKTADIDLKRNFRFLNPEDLEKAQGYKTDIENISNSSEGFRSLLTIAAKDEENYLTTQTSELKNKLLEIQKNNPNSDYIKNIFGDEKALEKIIEDLERLEKSSDKTTEDVVELETAFTRLAENLEGETDDALRNTGEKLSNLISKGSVNNITDLQNQGQDFSDDEINNVIATSENASNVVDNFINKTRNLSMAEQDLEDNVNKTNEAIENGANISDNSSKNFLTHGEVLTGVADAAFSLLAALQSIKSLGNIWGEDSDLSTWEKIESTMMIIGSQLPMLITSWGSLNKVIKTGSLENTLNAASSALASKGLLGLGASAGTAAAGETVATGATVGLTTSLKGLGIAVGKLTVALLPYIAIAAAIGAVAYGIYEAIEAYDAHNTAVDDASDKVKELTELYSSLTAEASSFKQEVSDYHDGINAINDLTKGTQEYYDAIKSANEKSKELIETYKLFDDYTIGTDGLIKIDEEDLSTIERRLDNAAAEVKKDEYAAQITKQGAINHRDIVELSRDKDYTYKGKYNVETQQWESGEYKFTSNQLEDLAKIVADSELSLNDFSKEVINNEEQLKQYTEEILGAEGSTQDFVNMISTMADQGGIEFNDYITSLREAAAANEYYAQQILNIELEQRFGEVIQKIADQTGIAYESLLASIQGDKELSGQLTSDLSGNSKDAKDIVSNLLGGYYTSSSELPDALNILKASGLDIFRLNKEDLVTEIAERQGIDTNLTEYNKDKGIIDADGNVLVSNEASLELLLTQLLTDILNDIDVEKVATDVSNEVDSKLNQVSNIAYSNAGNEYGVNFSQAAIDYLNATDRTGGMALDIGSLNQGQISELKGLTDTEILEMFGFGPGTKEIGDLTASQFIQGFREGLENNWSKEGYIANLRSKFEAEIEALDVDFNIDELEAYAEHLEDLEPLLEEDRELALDIAMAHMRLAESTETLAKNWDDWNKVMTSGDSLAIAKLSDDLAVVIQNMLNLTPEQFSLLPDDFVEDHWDMIQDVYNGVEGAVEGLQELAGEEILLGEIKASFNGQEISNEVKGLFAELEGMTPPQITVGTNIDQLDKEAQRYIELLNGIVQACDWTAEEASAKLLALGYNATFKQETKKVMMPKFETDDMGNEFKVGYEEVEIPVSAIQIETLYSRFGGNIGTSSSIANSGKTAGTSGGKDDTPKKMDTTDREDMVERYKEINDSLDDVADALSDVNKLTDRLYGKNRISALKNQNALLQQEIGLLKEKASQAKAYLAQDQSRLQSAAADLGASFSFDAQGNISNYTAQMNALYDQLAAAENKFNSLGSKTAQEEYQKSTLDPLNDKISELQDAISQYDETRELLEDIENEIDDAFYQWQDNNYEILTYELEIKIELNDLELKEIEYYLNKISDDFYQMAEAASLMMDKSPVIQEDLAAYGDYYEQLTSAYNAGDISQADYVEGLKESYDAIIDNLEALLELDKEMMEYYGKTVKAAQEELDKYTNRLEHLTGVLDHYKNLMDILGRNKDYASLGIILEGQAKTLKDELDVATKDYQMWVEQEAYWANQMEQTLSDPMAYELAKKNWEEAYDAMADAQDKMLTKTEEWTKALRAVLENQLAGYAQSLEDALTGGTNFDQMNDALERAQSLQEEFLTDTNKIYETEKLMRKARDDINKTNNEKAKQRLQGFIDETEELQNQAELSEFELKVQQAKYDLLLAEIALEEAQNAKSTVRLQRDSEGNFGYVYTADQAAVSDAEQQFADAQNNLYNIGLEGTYEYTEKYQQMVQEMYESLTQLQQDYLNGEFATEEEYQDAILATKEYYYEKLKDYSYLYSEALQADSRVVADSWAVDFEDMTLNTEMWMEHVDVYIDQVGNAFKIWAERSEAANEVVGDSLDETKEKVEEVTDASSDLKDEIVGEVIPAIEDELDSVNAATSVWAAQRAELYSVISTYEQLIRTIREAIAAQAALDNYQAKKVNTGSGGGAGGGNIGNNNYYNDDKNPVNPETGGPTSYRYEAIVERDNGHGEFGTQRVSGTVTPRAGEDLETAIARIHKANHATVIKTFDTGGYTGNWGPEGKLAFLHQKELVLNAADTENFLSAIGIIREISHAIDLQSLASQFSGLSSVGYNSNTSNVLEQNVHIEASFPNVSEHLEIEMALNNLVNTASQYANRK